METAWSMAFRQTGFHAALFFPIPFHAMYLVIVFGSQGELYPIGSIGFWNLQMGWKLSGRYQTLTIMNLRYDHLLQSKHLDWHQEQPIQQLLELDSDIRLKLSVAHDDHNFTDMPATSEEVVQSQLSLMDLLNPGADSMSKQDAGADE
jgi:hypothetical protein